MPCCNRSSLLEYKYRKYGSAGETPPKRTEEKMIKFYLSTTADIGYDYNEETKEEVISYGAMNTVEAALPDGLGLEIAEFCIAENLDDNLEETDRVVRKKTALVPDIILHGPYNELVPCAIDTRVRQVAWLRYEQALEAAKRYGARKIVFHGGYVPSSYYGGYFTYQSVIFWKKFLAEHPGDYQICLENVIEDDPKLLTDIAVGVDDPRFKLCLDVGHCNLTPVAPMEWLEAFAPYLSHLHIHNNQGRQPGAKAFSGDQHKGLPNGVIDMKAILDRALELCPDVTATIESSEIAESVAWLKENGYLGA